LEGGNMSRLSRLLGKPKECKVGGEVLMIYPLGMEDIDLVMQMEKEDKRPEAFRKIIIKTLKKAVPDATDAEINQLSFSYFKDITSAIMEVNGLSESDKE
jgi:hypothetical protein